jgi:hypothetical protein
VTAWSVIAIIGTVITLVGSGFSIGFLVGAAQTLDLATRRNK